MNNSLTRVDSDISIQLIASMVIGDAPALTAAKSTCEFQKK
jgi:hypothetical protein